MNTEITGKSKFEGWVLYDAKCRICAGLARRFQPALVRRHFELLPLQTPWVRTRLGLTEAELLAEMRLLTPNGSVLGGADAMMEIARRFRWTWPLRQIGRFPPAMTLFRAGYRWFARNRGCGNRACEIKSSAVRNSNLHSALLPLLVLPAVALLLRTSLTAWVFMWGMALALYAGCKWLTFCLAARTVELPNWRRTLGYLLVWPGMNAAEFLDRGNPPATPRGVEWLFATTKTVFGAILLWDIAPRVLPINPLLAGWAGMTGVILMLHFGCFHLLSLAWRRVGVRATPLMQNPLLATSLTEFWGRRWNTAFNELAFRFVFRPLRRRTTPAAATLLAFGLSGLIHELVISLPARGGFGLPTLYFLGQGLGVVAERSRWGGRIGLGRGARGWIFTLLVTAGPAFWLFHPPFINHVILPMLTAIGAT